MTVELAHDIIALKVWEQLPEQDKQLRLILTSLEQRLKDYESGAGSYLGEKELLAWEDYLFLIPLNEAQSNFIAESRLAIEQRKQKEQEQKNRELRLVQQKLALEQRTKKRQRIFIAALSLLTGLAFFAFVWASKKSQEAEVSAKGMSKVVRDLTQKKCEELFVSINNSLDEYDFNKVIALADSVKGVINRNREKIDITTGNQEIRDAFRLEMKSDFIEAESIKDTYKDLLKDSIGEKYASSMYKVNQLIKEKAFNQAKDSLKNVSTKHEAPLKIPRLKEDLKAKGDSINKQAFDHYFTTAQDDFNTFQSKQGKYINPYKDWKKAEEYASLTNNTEQKEQLYQWLEKTYCQQLLNQFSENYIPELQNIIDSCKQQ